MALDVTGVFNAFKSRLLELGVFDAVATHEPKNAPNGNPVSIIFSGTRPASSGLDSTSVVVDFTVRLFANMLHEPQDEIDPNTLAAVDSVCRALVGDFEFGGLSRAVDVRGSQGIPMTSRSGYAEYDRVIYRVVDITVPLIINDLWQESP